jgi:hypothetical protein
MSLLLDLLLQNTIKASIGRLTCIIRILDYRSFKYFVNKKVNKKVNKFINMILERDKEVMIITCHSC